jgi:Phage head maturation protease
MSVNLCCDPKTGLCTAPLTVRFDRPYHIPHNRRAKNLAGPVAASPEAMYLGLALSVKSLHDDDEEKRQVSFIASTSAMDRWGDVIEQDGWDLQNYLRNPVVLYGHSSWDLPVARVTAITLSNGALRVTMQFATAEQYPLAETLYRLVRGGYLNAVSVGFIPLEWEFFYLDDEDPVEDWPHMRYKRQELVEISLVTVPANPEALAVDRAWLPALRAVKLANPNVQLSASVENFSRRALSGFLNNLGVRHRLLPACVTPGQVTAELFSSFDPRWTPAKAKLSLQNEPISLPTSFRPVTSDEQEDFCVFEGQPVPVEGTMESTENLAYAFVVTDETGQERARMLPQPPGIGQAASLETIATRALTAILQCYEAGTPILLAVTVGKTAQGPVFRPLGYYSRGAAPVLKASAVQTVIFNKDNWTATEAQQWLSDHDFKSSDMDETENSFRFRQFPPDECDPDSYVTLTENLPTGVSLVVCDRAEKASQKPTEKSEPCHCHDGLTVEAILQAIGEDEKNPLQELLLELKSKPSPTVLSEEMVGRLFAAIEVAGRVPQ